MREMRREGTCLLARLMVGWIGTVDSAVEAAIGIPVTKGGMDVGVKVGSNAGTILGTAGGLAVGTMLRMAVKDDVGSNVRVHDGRVGGSVVSCADQ